MTPDQVHAIVTREVERATAQLRAEIAAERKHRIGAPAEPQVIAREFQLDRIHNNHVAAKLWYDGAAYGDVINIARSPESRRQELHDSTKSELTYSYQSPLTREVTFDEGGAGERVQQHQLIPTYYAINGGTHPGSLDTSIVLAMPADIVVLQNDGSTKLRCYWVMIDPRVYAEGLPS